MNPPGPTGDGLGSAAPSVPVHVGIDLAWNTNAMTGLAAVNSAGALVESGCVQSDQAIVDWLRRPHLTIVNLAIDAPIIVTNATGMRDCDRLVTHYFGRYDAGCHAANLSKAYMNPPRAWILAQRHGWNVDPAHESTTDAPGCIEVYPHPAMVGLFRLGRIIKYKKGLVEDRLAAFRDLVGRLESIDVLQLTSHTGWARIRAVLESSPRQKDLNLIEEEIDAVFCAHLAWLWHFRRWSLEMYGDVQNGYIIGPPPPTHATTPRPKQTFEAIEPLERVSHLVRFDVEATPTAGEGSGPAWRTAVGVAANLAMSDKPPIFGRFAVELAFMLPALSSGAEGGELQGLVQPTLDSLGRIIGNRSNPGFEQVDTERIDKTVVTKRRVVGAETPGATITVTLLSAA